MPGKLSPDDVRPGTYRHFDGRTFVVESLHNKFIDGHWEREDGAGQTVSMSIAFLTSLVVNRRGTWVPRFLPAPVAQRA